MNTGLPRTVVVVVAVVLGIGAWRYNAPMPLLTHVVVVMDASGSSPTRCDAIVGLAEKGLNLIDSGAGGTLAVFRLGDASTADDAQLVMAIERERQHVRVMENKGEAMQKKISLLNDIRSACDQVPTTGASPVFLGLTRAIDHLRSKPGAGALHVLFQSDLEETEEESIVEEIRASRHTSDLPKVDATDIGVTFCGYADTIGEYEKHGTKRRHTQDRNAASVERAKRVWKSVLGNSGTITFEPFCPQRLN